MLKLNSHHHQVFYYLLEMRFQHKDTVNDLNYSSKCYSTYDKLNNNGGLTLISPRYYDFYSKLMSKIRGLTDHSKLLDERNGWLSLSIKKMEEDSQLETEFCNMQTETNLTLESKKKIYRQLWQMILNRKAGDIIKMFSDENDCRHKKNGVKNVTFRTELQVKSQTVSEKKITKLMDKNIIV